VPPPDAASDATIDDVLVDANGLTDVPIDAPRPEASLDAGACSESAYITYRVDGGAQTYCLSLAPASFYLTYRDGRACVPLAQEFGSPASPLVGLGAEMGVFMRTGSTVAGIIMRPDRHAPQFAGLGETDCRGVDPQCGFVARDCRVDVLQGASGMGDIGEVRLAAPCVLHAEPAWSTTQITVTDFYVRAPLQLRFEETVFGTMCPNDR
jgi:hypothetical protein